MSDGINLVILAGHLGADPELKQSQTGGDSLLGLRVATSKSYFDKSANERKEKVSWHSVVVWGKYGEALAKFLAKGSAVVVQGSLETRSYEKNGVKLYSTRVVATNVCATGKWKGDGDQYSGNQQPPAPRQQYRQAAPSPLPHTTPNHDPTAGDDFAPAAPGFDDDLPF